MAILPVTAFITFVPLSVIEMAERPTYNELKRRVGELEKEAKELRNAEEQVKQQSEFLSSVLESLSHPFYVIDAHDYSIMLANSSAQFGSLTGESTCYALTHKRQTPCDSTEHPCPLEIIKRTQKPVVVEHIHFDKAGNPRNVEVHGGSLSGVEEPTTSQFDRWLSTARFLYLGRFEMPASVQPSGRRRPAKEGPQQPPDA